MILAMGIYAVFALMVLAFFSAALVEREQDELAFWQALEKLLCERRNDGK